MSVKLEKCDLSVAVILVIVIFAKICVSTFRSPDMRTCCSPTAQRVPDHPWIPLAPSFGHVH